VCSRNAMPSDLDVVTSWIGSQRECALWAGPTVPFPLDPLALPAQIDMAGAINVALDDEQGLAAFGQALPRAPGRAHLARVIVRPDARRHGLGRALVEALLSRAGEARLSRATLNVYSDNAAATTLYSDLGFERVERPPGESLSPGTWFMQRGIGPSTTGPSAQ
jgi:ribosomal protein S18 acetylase RimI-like enzyme